MLPGGHLPETGRKQVGDKKGRSADQITQIEKSKTI